ncbi:MAG: Gfo/Idh/MocA family oxidoreductase [Planctomycetaceae bacterium]|nr:Gfo/Idh/MocA family oxidoreductase [Planctomycetaceae bacterium]
MNQLRVAVVGCGHLGTIHARLLKSLDSVVLAGVVDPALAARERVAAECAVPAWPHIDELIDRVDAAVVATPTAHHHEVAERLLSAGIHVLIEKPITRTVAEANRLIALARRHGLVLQVGHVERFNPAWNAVAGELAGPQYIEAVRAGIYTFRSTDVSIVLDLMIHDLDLVLSLAASPVVDVEAMGLALFGPHEDLALARLQFANGCLAVLKASRVNHEPQRSMQVYSQQAYAAIDFAQSTARVIRPAPEVLRGEVDLTSCPPDQRTQVQESMFRDLLCLETLQVPRTNAILQEQREFVASVQQGAPVRVPGEQGREALAVAEQILASIRAHRWNSPSLSVAGPRAHAELARPAAKRAA